MSSSSGHIARALAECIELVLQGKLSATECAARYPEHRVELEALLPMAAELQKAPRIEPSAAFRRAARQRLLGRLEPHPGRDVSFLESLRHRWRRIGPLIHARRLSMSWILALILAASVIGGGGLAYAADAAAPGDALYGLDRAIEAARMNLTTDPAESIKLGLAFAEERALEVGQTAGHGETAHLGQALDNYGATISALARGVAAVEGPAGDKQDAQLTQALAVHDQTLQRAFEDDPEVDEAPERVRDTDRAAWCLDGEPDPDAADHLAAGMIVERYPDYTYESVMGWFCGGASFGDIMLAMRIVLGTEEPVTVDYLLLLRHGDGQQGWGQIMRLYLGDDGKSWGEIMRELAPGGGSDAAGPPDWAGPDDDGEGDGPLYGGEQGQQPENVPGGPPDDEGSPGMPEDAVPGPAGNGGSNEDAPQGSQGNAGAQNGAAAPASGGR